MLQGITTLLDFACVLPGLYHTAFRKLPLPIHFIVLAHVLIREERKPFSKTYMKSSK